ncbi:hypothetical protein CISG_00621 [Coccidioides immitis RMSCC 3703]|uniref:Uncharacterized protein n=1 Tax=Coccidioides immitis RMSCC 3703 TaxID=454286 RepID=A0A0J8QQE6_COCIT|nr:hypothetical protein CISG_00621 [Coccidioides immitis RMSCC 3703]
MARFQWPNRGPPGTLAPVRSLSTILHSIQVRSSTLPLRLNSSAALCLRAAAAAPLGAARSVIIPKSSSRWLSVDCAVDGRLSDVEESWVPPVSLSFGDPGLVSAAGVSTMCGISRRCSGGSAFGGVLPLPLPLPLLNRASVFCSTGATRLP